jgi:hypothetical protein
MAFIQLRPTSTRKAGLHEHETVSTA